MYICTCHSLRLTGRVAHRGDEVPEAVKWPENVRRSVIALGQIALKDDPKVKGRPETVRAPSPPSMLSPDQLERKRSALPWLLAESSKGRILPLEPGPAADLHTPGAVALQAGQGPSATTQAVEYAAPDPETEEAPEPAAGPATGTPPPAEERQQSRGNQQRRGRR